MLAHGKQIHRTGITLPNEAATKHAPVLDGFLEPKSRYTQSEVQAEAGCHHRTVGIVVDPSSDQSDHPDALPDSSANEVPDVDADYTADGDTIGSSEQGSHSCAHARAHEGALAQADSCADQGTDEAAHGFPVE